MFRTALLLLVCTLGCGGTVPTGSVETAPVSKEAAQPSSASQAEGFVEASGQSRPPGGAEGQHPRKIVYTAKLDLVVEDFTPVPARVAELAEEFGGYVADSNLYGQPGQPRRATWTIRVPVDRYGELLSKARALGEMRSLTTDAKDVSEEYYDVEARIRNKQKTEARLLELLEKAAGNLDQVLAVEEKLDRVREEIERMQGRLRVLADLADLATVTITVEEIKGFQAEEEPTYSTRVRRAFSGSLRALGRTGMEVSIAVVALAPWLAVLVVLGLVFAAIGSAARRIQRRKKSKTPPDGPVAAEVVDS